jgi:hypothetical protein
MSEQAASTLVACGGGDSGELRAGAPTIEEGRVPRRIGSGTGQERAVAGTGRAAGDILRLRRRERAADGPGCTVVTFLFRAVARVKPSAVSQEAGGAGVAGGTKTGGAATAEGEARACRGGAGGEAAQMVGAAAEAAADAGVQATADGQAGDGSNNRDGNTGEAARSAVTDSDGAGVGEAAGVGSVAEGETTDGVRTEGGVQHCVTTVGETTGATGAAATTLNERVAADES